VSNNRRADSFSATQYTTEYNEANKPTAFPLLRPALQGLAPTSPRRAMRRLGVHRSTVCCRMARKNRRCGIAASPSRPVDDPLANHRETSPFLDLPAVM